MRRRFFKASLFNIQGSSWGRVMVKAQVELGLSRRALDKWTASLLSKMSGTYRQWKGKRLAMKLDHCFLLFVLCFGVLGLELKASCFTT
jgi:hypothetical protein